VSSIVDDFKVCTSPLPKLSPNFPHVQRLPLLTASSMEYAQLKQPQDHKDDGDDDYDGEEDNEPANAFGSSPLLVVSVEP